MRHVYFVTFSHSNGIASCESALDAPISHIDDVRKIEAQLRQDEGIRGFLMVTNFIPLRVEP